MADAGAIVAAHLEARERARMSDRVFEGLCLTFAAMGIALAGWLIGPLNAERTALGMNYTQDLIGQVPPDIAMLNTTLGPLRGLWIYALWIQADQLKEQRRFYDALQRAEWICKLQPRFPDVWEFQSWNMAYNISVTCQTDEERWRWVRNGYDLITTQGIRLNPRSEKLYKQAAWLLFHKMGDVMDDMHWVYKKEWATEMERLLGRPAYGASGDEVVDRFRRIAESPATVEQLARGSVSVSALMGELKELGYEADRALLWAHHDAAIRTIAMGIASDPEGVIGGSERALWELMASPARKDAADMLLACLRHEVLVEEYNMDPAWMLKLMEQYGPLDWRVVYAGSLYWSTKGAEMSTIEGLSDASTEIQRDRLILFSLRGMFQTGRIMFTPDLGRPGDSFFAQFSDLSYVDALHTEYVRYGAKHDEEAAEGTGGYYMSSGHVNALHEAIRMLWVRGLAYPEDRARAQELFDYLREHYRASGGGPKREYMIRLSEWVEIDIRRMAQRARPVVQLLTGFFDAEMLALSTGRKREAGAYLEWAGRVYALYLENKADHPTDRLALPPFEILHTSSIERFFMYAQVPIPYKSHVFLTLPLPLQRATYDLPMEALRVICDATGYDAAKAFPEPEGMDAWRKAHPSPTTQMYLPELEPLREDEPRWEFEAVDTEQE